MFIEDVQVMVNDAAAAAVVCAKRCNAARNLADNAPLPQLFVYGESMVLCFVLSRTFLHFVPLLGWQHCVATAVEEGHSVCRRSARCANDAYRRQGQAAVVAGPDSAAGEESLSTNEAHSEQSQRRRFLEHTNVVLDHFLTIIFIGVVVFFPRLRQGSSSPPMRENSKRLRSLRRYSIFDWQQPTPSCIEHFVSKCGRCL
jgi:hypothetical protein